MYKDDKPARSDVFNSVTSNKGQCTVIDSIGGSQYRQSCFYKDYIAAA